MQRICAKEIKGGTELAFISRSSFEENGEVNIANCKRKQRKMKEGKSIEGESGIRIIKTIEN